MDCEDSLQGKRILITGADRGIGAALALRSTEMGARVCVNLFAPAAESGTLLALLTRAGRKTTLAVQADVRDPAQIEAMFRVIADNLGGLDALVNNAGVESIHAALDLSADEWDRVLDTNLRGSFLCAQGAARIMKEQDGAVSS